MKLLKRTLTILAILFGVIQLVRPAKVSPPIDEHQTIEAHTQPSPEVARVLETLLAIIFAFL